MSTRKYRLAAPTISGKTNVLYKPTSFKVVYDPLKLRTLDNVEANTNKALLNGKQKLEETESFVPPARWWLVLPPLLLIIIVSAVDPLLMNDLVVRRYESRYGLDASPSAQHKACSQSTTTAIPNYYLGYPSSADQHSQNQPNYNLVQRDAANFNTKNSLVALIPALVTSVLLGSNCDIIGRRPLLILPFVGKIVWYSLMLIIVAHNLSDTWLLVAHAIESVFGSSGLVLLSAFSYITDCTSGSMRTHAFLLTEGITFFIRIAPAIAIGIWLRYHLYTTPLSFCLSLSVIGLLYALFIQPESIENV
ncbi:unnamed protein product [Adineta steineri]|uniref:Major facilitator superfamily (MFS) profile domain-containing protein n=1 Tax=Adineta steineri TaxID=433720 RepID=A0A814G1K1_9BILA|nr:unnamed protein product [Adineta steineri]CAF1176301.1 unnamed protein product [Adineta steineri]